MTIEEIPPLPTREQEKEYMKWLKNSILEDPIVTWRYRCYMAGPNRYYWKNMIKMRKEYRKNLLKNFIISVVVSWPLIIL